jgi:cytochrome c
MGIKIAVFALAGLAIVSAQTPKRPPRGDAARGKTVFGNQCSVCHAPDSNVKKLGPGLKGLFKKAKLQNGKPVNETTVGAGIDAGGNGMPAFKEMLNPAQREDLIAYLRTL